MQEKYLKIKLAREAELKKLEEEKLDFILRCYIEFYKQKGGIVSIVHFCKFAEISESLFKNRFQSIKNIDKIAREKYPQDFDDILVETLLDTKSKKNLQSVIKKSKRFVITTAVTGCEVQEGALASIKRYCALNKAQLLVLLCSDPAHATAQKGGYGTIDKALKDEILVTEDIKLNSNFYISTIKTTAKQINPITGLGRIGQKNGSFVYASPKQMLQLIPVSNVKLPHAVMTTGAITKSNYNTNKYMSERTAYIAENDHKLGAIIVEVQNTQIFHFRQIQFDKDGSFCDMGKMYSPKGVKVYAPEALIPGDWHSGEVDPQVSKAIRELIIKLKPKKVILHDVFNGMSINHFEKGNKILKAQRAENCQLDLKAELQNVAYDLNMFAKMVNEVIIVKSNHDEFLSHYLSDCGFLNDPFNYRVGLELSTLMLDGKNPVQEGVRIYGEVNFSNVRWLKRDEDFKIAGIECGAHGDKGPNGSKGNLVAMEKSYGKSVTGHSHTPGILREAWAVGTSSELKLEYNKGPSSWLQTLCLIYPNGHRQLINVI